MSVLATGLLLWVVVHLFPSLLPEQRQKLISRIGDKAYQGIFALCILAGLALSAQWTARLSRAPVDERRQPITAAVLGAGRLEPGFDADHQPSRWHLDQARQI